MSDSILEWAKSKTVGGVTELAVFAPIKRGCPPGERRTYEDRLRFVISRIQGAVDQNLPSHLSLIPTIHFGLLTIIRPEQYMLYARMQDGKPVVPPVIDEYEETPIGGDDHNNAPAFYGDLEPRSYLLTNVFFDGDLHVYIRDIAEFIETDFDNVYSNCEDYPSAGDFEQFWLWAKRYQLPTEMFHNACRDLSVPRIKQLENFKEQFDRFVLKVRTPEGRKGRSMEDLFDEFLRENREYPSDFPTGGGIFVPKS